MNNSYKWINKDGVIAKAFPILSCENETTEFKIKEDLEDVSEKFSIDNPSKSPFQNSGIMINGRVYTQKVQPNYKRK